MCSVLLGVSGNRIRHNLFNTLLCDSCCIKGKSIPIAKARWTAAVRFALMFDVLTRQTVHLLLLEKVQFYTNVASVIVSVASPVSVYEPTGQRESPKYVPNKILVPPLYK
jgi:hypothetical protein